MRNLDYICESTAHPSPVILRDVQGESGSPPPPCPTCSAPCEVLWASSYAHNPAQFKPVSLYADLGDGKGKRLVEVTTLHQLRQVEGRTRRLWEQGLGDPIAIRQLSQDASNYEEGIFDEHDTRPAPVPREGRGVLSRYRVGRVGDRDVPREVLRAIDEGRIPVVSVDLGE